MTTQPVTFALYFGNRGFFPETLIDGARRELSESLKKLGFKTLIMDVSATRYGAVETPEEGRRYAAFLESNRGKFDGVILCLPNFGDETGAVAALRDAGVPIFVHAYPDELDKMGFKHRRDAFCGKFSIMDVFFQHRIPFSVTAPHTAHPKTEDFARNMRWFAGVCRVVKQMKRVVIGAIGARTTAFKTIRFDELALERHGITTETYDLSEVLMRYRAVDSKSAAFKAKANGLKKYSQWKGVPEDAFSRIVTLGVVVDDMIREYGLQAIGLRCWLELEKEIKVSPCVLLSELNERGIAAACELDVCNAAIMTALSAAADQPAACLDWNNNYGDDPDRCILFHCGPVPQAMMEAKGRIIEQPMFAKALGAGCGFGCNLGRLAPAPLTYSSAMTDGGKLHYYLGEGEITSDKVSDEFFGASGVVRVPNLQKVLLAIGRNGFRHHVSLTSAHVAAAVREAFNVYLGYQETAL
jgi:L-fucose isomerase-like protein